MYYSRMYSIFLCIIMEIHTHKQSFTLHHVLVCLFIFCLLLCLFALVHGCTNAWFLLLQYTLFEALL